MSAAEMGDEGETVGVLVWARDKVDAIGQTKMVPKISMVRIEIMPAFILLKRGDKDGPPEASLNDIIVPTGRFEQVDAAKSWLRRQAWNAQP